MFWPGEYVQTLNANSEWVARTHLIRLNAGSKGCFFASNAAR
jgi:hypothetical protein